MHFMGMTAMKLQDNMGHFYDVRCDPPLTCSDTTRAGLIVWALCVQL
jgi:hypothetical protein